jgi:hypothetical protein
VFKIFFSFENDKHRKLSEQFNIGRNISQIKSILKKKEESKAELLEDIQNSCNM